LSAGAGQAAQKALFSFNYSSFGAAALVGGVSITIPRTGVVPNTFDWFEATVETGAGTPSPSVMWPARVLSEVGIVNAGGTITPGGVENPSAYGLYFSFVQDESNYNVAATFKKGSGLTANTSWNWPATTTICNNTCVPRDGTGFQTIGANRYGGVAHLVDRGISSGLKKNFVLGGFTQQLFSFATTAMGLQAGYPGLYAGLGKVQVTTPNSATFESPAHGMWGKYSTGTARARLTINAYTTDATKQGSVNINTGNLTGTISLVRPFHTTSWRKVGGTVVGIGSGSKYTAVNVLEVTFLPEPSQIAMLGAGILGLGGLYRRRFL